MAKPIAPTPTLSGEDAKRFIAAAQNPQPFHAPTVNNEKFLESVKEKFRKHGQK